MRGAKATLKSGTDLPDGRLRSKRPLAQDGLLQPPGLRTTPSSLARRLPVGRVGRCYALSVANGRPAWRISNSRPSLRIFRSWLPSLAWWPACC